MSSSILYSLAVAVLIALPVNTVLPLMSNSSFTATFGALPSPFEIDVNPTFIAQTEQKASLTRYTVDLDQPDFVDGPPQHNVSTVRDYWVQHYEWIDVQRQLNAEYSQFTTTVTTVTTGSPSNFSDPVPLHFVHQVSPRADAIPLLFIHGWPGTFLEVGPIISNLTHSPSDAYPAFHVVAPSLPSFGFSPAPVIPGLNILEIGRAFNSLMLQLDYPKYVILGGDLGAFTLREMAGSFPDNVISVLSNFWVVAPNATDLERYATGKTTAEENATIAVLQTYDQYRSGYRFIMQTWPLQAMIAMMDSPLGNAMFNYNLMHGAVDNYVWTPEEIITWSMMYYIPGPYGAARLYKECFEEGLFTATSDGKDFPFVTQPVAISQLPKDTKGCGTPLDWARRYGNVVVRNVHDRGGHFATIDAPDLLLQDVWGFWGNASLSGVNVLYSG